MATNMEKRTFGTTRHATRCRNLAEQIRQQLLELGLAASRRGEYGIFRVDHVSVSSTMLYARGDRQAADAAAKLFRQAGTDATVNEHCSGDGSFEACGIILA